MLNAIAGKVLRVQKFNMPKELTTALAAAVGTNFCNDIYGKSACFLYTIDGADSIGFPLSDRYYRIFSAPALAQSAMVKDMAQEYLKNPLLQVLGSLLEAIRMSFLESPQRLETGVRILDLSPRLWHFFGSLLVWLFFFRGLKASRSFSSNGRSFLWVLLSLLAFHYAVMSQFTNLVRYIYPMLPVIYFFAALGIASFGQRSRGRPGSAPAS
jgi:hypothetical protein